MVKGSYLSQLLNVIVVLGFSGIFKECWTQGGITSPVILVHPDSVNIRITRSNQNATLMCLAIGESKVTYRWERENSSLPNKTVGQNTHELTLLDLRPSDTGNYRCRVSNMHGTVFSNYAHVNVTGSLRAVVEPHNVTVEITMSVDLSCTASGYEMDGVRYTWEVIQIREGVEPSKLHNVTSSHLSLMNVTTSAGYRCVVTTDIGTTASSAYSYITVVVRPPNIIAAYANQSVYQVGSLAVFVCRGVGFGRLHFNWQRQTGNIPPSAVIHTNNGTLIIPVLSSSDIGNYRCIVSDDWNGTVYSEYIQLNVSEKPLVISANSQSMLVRQQSNVSFSCVVVDRHVDTTFLWSRVNGKPLSNRAHGSNSSVLIIVGVEDDDEGEYKCTATTGNQTFTTTALLTVYGFPMVHEMREEHVTEVGASHLVLTCTAQNDPDSPHPLEMSWYKGDTQLHRGLRYRISNILGSNGVNISLLTISGVQKDDAGQYSCRVSPGDISTETTVVVNYKPEITSFQILPQNSVMLGEAVQLLCQVDANPLPSVTIYRNSKVIFMTRRKVVDYQIRQVSADDDNTLFSCGAENSVGTVLRQNVTLTVTGIPSVQPSTTASVTMASASTTLISPTPTPTPHPIADIKLLSRGLTFVQLQWTGIQEQLSYFRVKLYCVSPCTGNVMKSFTTMNTSITVYGLEPGQTYAVQVAAVISDEVISAYSEPLQVSTAANDSVLFQLRLVSETACNEWKDKLDVMTAAIVNDIIGHCACPLSPVDLFSDTISCDNKDHVIYRAGLSTSAQLDTEEILTILKEWTTQTSTLVVDGSSLQIDRSCTLVLSSFDDPTCGSTSANPPGAGSNSDVIPILAGIIGGIIIGGVLITVLVVILVIKCRGKTDKIRPGGNTPENASLKRPQRRSTGRRGQANEEATYSEVFNNLPLCATQSCPAYQASIHFDDDHDYVDIESNNGSTDISADVFATNARPVQSHNEIELSASSSSVARSNGNDYSEPLRLSQRLDNRTSKVLLTQMPSKGCSDYLKPIRHKTGSKDSGVDVASSQTHTPQEGKVPSDYIEPVSIKNSEEHLNLQSKQQQYDHLSSNRNITNIYSELN